MTWDSGRTPTVSWFCDALAGVPYDSPRTRPRARRAETTHVERAWRQHVGAALGLDGAAVCPGQTWLRCFPTRPVISNIVTSSLPITAFSFASQRMLRLLAGF